MAWYGVWDSDGYIPIHSLEHIINFFLIIAIVNYVYGFYSFFLTAMPH